jgi:acylphosphatase
VQNVWFRDGCARVAASERVDGWVRNLADGRVEAVFEGEQVAVDRCVAWCREGPTRARVVDLEIREESTTDEPGFTVR